MTPSIRTNPTALAVLLPGAPSRAWFTPAFIPALDFDPSRAGQGDHRPHADKPMRGAFLNDGNSTARDGNLTARGGNVSS